MLSYFSLRLTTDQTKEWYETQNNTKANTKTKLNLVKSKAKLIIAELSVSGCFNILQGEAPSQWLELSCKSKVFQLHNSFVSY